MLCFPLSRQLADQWAPRHYLYNKIIGKHAVVARWTLDLPTEQSSAAGKNATSACICRRCFRFLTRDAVQALPITVHKVTEAEEHLLLGHQAAGNAARAATAAAGLVARPAQAHVARAEDDSFKNEQDHEVGQVQAQNL